MLEQIKFSDTVSLEVEAFKLIKSILSMRADYLDKLELSEKQSYFSITLMSSLLCRLKFVGKSYYIALGTQYMKYVPSEFIIKEQDTLYSLVMINTVDDINKLSEAINKAYSDVLISCAGDSFDCCHKYLQCSNAKECLHDDKIRALACTYKRKLEKGIVYYGENRNIE